MTRTKSLAWSWLWKAAVASSLLLSGSAWAQTATSNAPGSDPRNARMQAAYEQWRKISPQELRCVDQTLHARKSSVQALIQRGIGPSDTAVASLRTGCRTQAQAKPPAPTPVVVANAPKANPVKEAASNIEVQALNEYWSFNGSILNSEAKGDLRRFYFFKPHPEIEATGAHRGALFAEGKMMSLEGNALSQRFVGQAFHFGGRCGAIPYRVDGTIRDNNRRLEWQGQKPRLDADCKMIGTDLDALTLKLVTPEFAASTAAATEQVATEKAGADKAAAARAEAAEAAAEKAAADRATAEKAAAEKAAAEKAAADKVAAEKAATEKAAAEKAAAEKAKTDKSAAEKAAAEKAAAEKAAAAKAAAEKLAAERAAAVQAAAERAAAEQAAAEKAAMEKAAAERAAADNDHAGLGLADNAAIELMKMNMERALASAAAESRLSFIYGLICGPILFGLGALVFFLLNRKRSSVAQSIASYDRSRIELDRLTSAFLAGQKRGEASAVVPPASRPTPGADFNEFGAAWSRLHPQPSAPQPRPAEKVSARIPEKTPPRARETQPAGTDRRPL